MKIYQTEEALRAHLSPAEEAAYLSGAWRLSATAPDMTTEAISMHFETPTRGVLNVKGSHLAGEKFFVIELVSEFSDEAGGATIQRTTTLVGDAHTGVIIAMLSQGCDEQDAAPELDWTQIQECLRKTGDQTIWQLQREGFGAFSRGLVTIPPVIYMAFEGRGDLHMKGAHEAGSDIYVFKIATAFPGNVDSGLQSSQGLMIAFDAKTGEPRVVLKDEGHLTDLRTAIAGRNAALALMPATALTGIGVLGTGVQARLQIAQLQSLYPDCRELAVWGRTPDKAARYAKEMSADGWTVTVVDSPRQVAETSNLIITTTPSTVALLDANDIRAGNTLIIAVGADMPGKVELTPALLRKADVVVIDSIVQGKDHGNAAVAIVDGVIAESDLIEFGNFLNNTASAEADDGLKIFLSSGIGVQDLKIVQAVIAGCAN